MAATISRRLGQATGFLRGGNQSSEQLPWNPDATRFPTRKELPKIPGAPEGAAWVWGKDDQIGRLNLLTPKRVKAASAEIKTGEVVPLNLPLNTPETPAFGREKFVHKIKVLVDNVCYDDQYELNTQSGTQWDGFRHFAHMPTQTFYNGAKGTDIVGPTANHKCSIHHWAEHGIAGRGILLDYWGYSKATTTTRTNLTASRSRISRNAARPRGSTSGPRPKAATSKSAISYSSARDSWNNTTN
ncbi:hypothetical protein DTO280E4_6381 [Paecilomyces variotii]|nr:hypothetical protein DTO280E4_6381 [Paecilomyces variotii]